MKFFITKHSTDLKAVGAFPQLEKMFDGFNMLRPYEVWGGRQRRPHSSHGTLEWF